MKTRITIVSDYGLSALNRTDRDGTPIPYGLRLKVRLGDGDNLEDYYKLKFRLENMLKGGWGDLN